MQPFAAHAIISIEDNTCIYIYIYDCRQQQLCGFETLWTLYVCFFFCFVCCVLLLLCNYICVLQAKISPTNKNRVNSPDRKVPRSVNNNTSTYRKRRRAVAVTYRRFFLHLFSKRESTGRVHDIGKQRNSTGNKFFWRFEHVCATVTVDLPIEYFCFAHIVGWNGCCDFEVIRLSLQMWW